MEWKNQKVQIRKSFMVMYKPHHNNFHGKAETNRFNSGTTRHLVRNTFTTNNIEIYLALEGTTFKFTAQIT